jgi:hypothetical protein
MQGLYATQLYGNTCAAATHCAHASPPRNARLRVLSSVLTMRATQRRDMTDSNDVDTEANQSPHRGLRNGGSELGAASPVVGWSWLIRSYI